jgi:hypothetical protein
MKLTVGAVLAYKEGKMTSAVNRYWTGDVPVKDDFGMTIGIEFIDGKTRAGYWAIMTPMSWRAMGIGMLGLGRGQRYKKQNDNRWMKVEG